MNPLDPNKTLAELLASDKGQVVNPEPEIELTEEQKKFVEFLKAEPDTSENDQVLGEFNKTLVAGDNKQVAIFSNPPSLIEMASTELDAPFLPKPRLQQEKSLADLLQEDLQGITETEPVSAEILPQDARLELQSFEKPQEPESWKAGELPNALMRGFYSNISGAADAYGALTSGLGYVTQGKPYPVESTLGYQLARKYEQNVEGTFPVSQETQESLPGQVAGAVGQSSGMLLAGPAGRTLGLTGTQTTMITGSTISGGQSISKALSEGATDEQALKYSALNALFGTSEAIPMAKWVDKLDDSTGGQFSRGFIGYMKEVAKEGAEEFSQEAFQTWASNFFEKIGYNPNQELTEDLLQSAKVGGTSGVLVSAVVNALGLRLRRRMGSGSTPEISNAPLTSQAQAEVGLEKEVAESLKPMTEYERPDEDILKTDEPFDLGSLMPTEGTTSGQPSTTQKEEAATTTPEEVAPGENVQPGPAEQGQAPVTPQVEGEEIAGTGRLPDELNFSRPGRPAKVDTQATVDKPLAADQELPVGKQVDPDTQATVPVDPQLEMDFKRAGDEKPYTTLVPENKLTQQFLFKGFSGTGTPKLDPKLQRSVDYSAEYYLNKLRPEFLEAGRIKDGDKLFPSDLSYAEFADKIIPILKQADLVWPDDEELQAAFVREVKNTIAVLWQKPKGQMVDKAKELAKGTPPPEEAEVDLPVNVSTALSDLNARYGRLQQNRPEPVRRLPRVSQPGSRVSNEISFSEESTDYLAALEKLPESPDEAQNLAEAERAFREKASKFKLDNPNLTVDETRLANAARMRYWRQLRRKYDVRKNKTSGVTDKEANELFQTQDVPGISKNRIFRSVVEDYSRKLGRRLGGKIGLESAVSLQKSLGDDSGDETLEDVIASPTVQASDEDVRSDLRKNAKNAYFASVEDPGQKYLLGAALNEASRKNQDPKEFAKNTTKLSEIAGVLNSMGYKTSTGELAKSLPKLIDGMVAFVKEKYNKDLEAYQKTGQLPEVIQGPQKTFRVLSETKGKPQLTAFDRESQALARDLLEELYESGFLTNVEVAEIQDQLDMSPRQAAANKAIQLMQAILASKQPGVGIKEPALKVISDANPAVPNVVPNRYLMLPHQREAANLIVNAYKVGREAALLADDAGLGKTRSGQAAARVIADMKAAARNEPYGKVIVITESNELINASTGGLKSQLASANIPKNRVFFYTYDAYSKNSIKDIESADVILFDEAQNLKNTTAIRNQMARQTKAFKIFLTATPADRLSGALYFLPGILGKSETTVRSMLEISKNKEETIANLVESAATVGAYIRRVPEGINVQTSRVELNAGPQIKAQIEQIEGYYRRQISELTGDPSVIPTVEQQRKTLELEGVLKFKTEAWAEVNKAPYIFEMAMQDLRQGKQVVVFGEFVNEISFPEINFGKTPSMLEMLNDMFRKEGIQPAVIYGEGGAQMTSDINDFQVGLKRVALVTPMKGGAGLSLDDQTGTAPRVVYIATPNEAADKHDQILKRAGYRLSSMSEPVIKELVASDIWTDLERIRRRESKQGVLAATQGVLQQGDSNQPTLPFQGSTYVDGRPQIPKETGDGKVYAKDLQGEVRRQATVLRNGQLVDERFSSLSPYQQDVVDEFAKALSDLKFKNVKIIFGDRGDMAAWVSISSPDFNTVYIKPEVLLNNRDRISLNMRGRVGEAGRGYLLSTASEEMAHNATYAVVRTVAVQLYDKQIRSGELTAQEAYSRTMNYLTQKAFEEISPEALELLRKRYGRELDDKSATIEYIRFVLQKARLGYTTEDFIRPSEADEESLRQLLKGVPKDGYLAMWFKALRQAVFDILGRLGITVKDSPFLGSVLDATDNILFHLEKYGPNAPPKNNESIASLLKLVSTEEGPKVTLREGGSAVTAEPVDLSSVTRTITHATTLKRRNPGDIVDFGPEQKVRDASGQRHPFVYAWVKRSKVQASHMGSEKFFGANSRYTGRNTRNYSYDPAEKEKILKIQGPGFDPQQIVNEGAGSPNQGLPTLIFDKAVGEWMVVGGNAREQVLGYQFAKSPENVSAMLDLAKDMTARMGGEIPADLETGGYFLYRVMTEQVDTSTQEGSERLDYLVKVMNAEGGSELTHLQKADQDYDAVAKSETKRKKLRSLAVDLHNLTREGAQTFIKQLVEENVIDRDSRAALLSSAAGSQPVEYLQYMILREFLQPMDRHLNAPKSTTPATEMVREVMDQGNAKNLYLSMAQCVASSEVLGEKESAQYKAFFSRLMNQMLSQKARNMSPYAAIKELASSSNVMDLLDEKGTATNKFPEIDANPEFRALVDFMSEKIGPTTKLENGKTKYTAKSATLFNVMMDELAAAFSDNSRQGNAEDMFSVSPIQKAMEAVTFRVKEAQKPNQDLESKEWVSGTGTPRTREEIEREKREVAKEFAQLKMDVVKKTLDYDRASMQRPVEFFGEEVYEDETDYSSGKYNNPNVGLDDEEFYDGMDINAAAEEAAMEDYASKFAYLATKQGHYMGVEGFQITTDQQEKYGPNLANLEVFDSPEITDEVLEQRGFKSRWEYNKLLAALEAAGMENYFRFKKVLETIAKDEQWLEETIELAKTRKELRDFMQEIKKLSEPMVQTKALQDPVVNVLFGPFRKAIEVTKTNSRILSYEDEAVKKLVETNKHTKEILRFLNAIGDQEKTKEARELAEKAVAAYEQWLTTNVSIPEITGADADWDAGLKKWVSKKAKQELPPAPLDKAARRRLQMTMKLIDQKSIRSAVLTPSIPKRVNEYRNHLKNLEEDLRKQDQKILLVNQEILSELQMGEENNPRAALAFKKRSELQAARQKILAEKTEVQDVFDRMLKTEYVSQIKVDDSQEGVLVTEQELNNLPPAIVAELKRRGMVPKFGQGAPVYKKTIEWTFPANYLGLANVEDKKISAEILYQETKEKGWSKAESGEWQLPVSYGGVGMILKYNSDKNVSGNFKIPIFTDGSYVPSLHAEYAASAYYTTKKAITITRDQGTDSPTLMVTLPVEPDLSAIRRVEFKSEKETQSLKPATIIGMKPAGTPIIKSEPMVDERGNSMWEFQLHPEIADINAKRLLKEIAGKPNKRGGPRGEAMVMSMASAAAKINRSTGSIGAVNSRSKKIYIRARNADEAVMIAVQKLGEQGDIYYKGKWYGKNIATRTKKVDIEKTERPDNVAQSQIEVRKALRKQRIDLLMEAIEQGRATNSSFDYVVKREAEAYLAGRFEAGASINDQDIVKVGMMFGWVTYRKGEFNKQGLEKIQQLALLRNTPKSMSVVNRSKKISATGPMRSVTENMLFAGKSPQMDVPVEATEYVVPEGRKRTSDEVLADIAAKNGVSVQDLKKANNLTMGKVIVGSQLLIPGTTKSVEVPPFFEAPEQLTLLEIATKYGLTREEVAKHNNLPTDYQPKPGDVIKIPESPRTNNLMDLALKIIKERSHVTYPQMLYKDRAPTGVQLVSRNGEVAGTGSIYYDGEDAPGRVKVPLLVNKTLVENAIGQAKDYDLVNGLTELIQKAFKAGNAKTKVSVTVDKVNNRYTIIDNNNGMSAEELERFLFERFEHSDRLKLTPLDHVIATSGISISTNRDGVLTEVSLTPESLLDENNRYVNMYSHVDYGDATGVTKGTKIVIQPRTVLYFEGVPKIPGYHELNSLDLYKVDKTNSQKLEYSEIGRNAKTSFEINKRDKLSTKETVHPEPPVTGGEVKARRARPKFRFTWDLIDKGAIGFTTLNVSREGARGNVASQMIVAKYPFNGRVWQRSEFGLLVRELEKQEKAGTIKFVIRNDDVAGTGSPYRGEQGEREARGMKYFKKREGKERRQVFAGQLARDERLGDELRSATALGEFKYSVRTQPLRAEEMLALINRVGGAEQATRAILSPDLSVNDEELQAIRDGSTRHFDNIVILNSILIQQLEKAAKENPERANEIRAMQFALAKKQADLGTSLAQGLRAFGAYSRIGVAGWMWFATNAKQVERLRQVGLFADDIAKAKMAGDQAIDSALEKVFGKEEVSKLGGLIESTANNAIWAQLLLKAKRIASISSEWQRMSTNTLSDVLDQQIKTAKEMVELLKKTEDSAETRRQISATVAEGTAALLQKGTASAKEVAKELGVSEGEVLENIEEAQDVLDESAQATTNEINNHLWNRFGTTMMSDEADEQVSGTGSPVKDVNKASRKIIENVLDGFLENFERALDAKDAENKAPKETAVGIIRRILRERVQLQGNGQLKLTRSKMSQEQRKLQSVRRFREAMNNWESLQTAVQMIYDSLKDSVDEGSYQLIVEAMQQAMNEPFTTADVRSYMTLPSFNFKEFVFNRRYLLTARKAEVLADLVAELKASGIEVKEDVLGRVLSKISDEMEKIAQTEIQRSIQLVFGKSENRATRAIRDNLHNVVKAALAGNLTEQVIYGYVAKKLKLDDENWMPSEETKKTIEKLANEIANDPDGPDSRRAGRKTMDILDAIKKDSGVTVLEAFVGQFYTNILQGVKTITVNLLSPIGNALNLGAMLGVRVARDKNMSSVRVAMKAIPRAINNALVEAIDLLATGDSSGKTLAPGKTLSTRVSGRPLPELLGEGGVRINANSSFGRGVAKLAELWFGWNKRGVWPQIPISKSTWDKTFKLVRGGLKKVGAGTIRAPEYGDSAAIQVSPTGLGILISRLYNSLDLATTTFYSELAAALAASDVSRELAENYPDRDVPDAQGLLSSDLGSMLRAARQIAGTNERLPEGLEGPEIVRKLEREASEERVERLKPGTLEFRQQLYLSARRNRGLANPYWNRVWNRASEAERKTIDRMVGAVTDEAFFLGSVLAYTNKPMGVTGFLAKTLEGWSNDHLIAKLVQPFYGIVTSVYQTWLSWMGTGILKSMNPKVKVWGEGTRQKPSDMRAMELGGGIAGLGIMLAGLTAIIARTIDGDDDEKERFLDFSGKGPSDPAFRQALIDSGKWQPESIKVGNMWFKNPNWLPTFLLFKSLGYMRDYSKYEKPNQAKAGELAMQFSLAGLKSMLFGIVDVPFLSGVKTLADLGNLDSGSWDKKAVAFLMRTGGSMLFGNLLREADRKIFPEKTDNYSSIMAAGIGNIPFLRNFNHPMTNVLGEPMLSDGSELPKDGWDRAKQAFFNYGDIIMRYRDNPDPLWVELAKKRAWVTLPERQVRVRGVLLNEEQRDDWVMERAKVLRETLRDPEWLKELPERTSGDVQNEITRLTSRANKSADLLVLNKYELWQEASDKRQLKRELGPRNVD